MRARLDWLREKLVESALHLVSERLFVFLFKIQSTFNAISSYLGVEC